MPADVELSVDQRILEAAAVLPSYGGVTGWAGLRWMGAVWFDGVGHGRALGVTLAIGDRKIRPQAGVATSEERLGPDELVPSHGIRVTTPLRSLFFEIRYASSDTEAVQAADMAAYSDLVRRDELIAFTSINPGWTGVQRARTAALDMDENVWSPTETTMRRTWEHEARLPRPLCNRPVFDLAGRHVATPDLLDVVHGVAGDYDGAVHLESAQRSKDVARQARLRAVGLEYVVMLAGDLPQRDAFAARLRDAYARAARLPTVDRGWTPTLPHWWVPTFTVEQRRRLDERQRARLLRYRRAV